MSLFSLYFRLISDFIEPSEARSAFKGLAYRKYKHLPLYLEWAPVGVIDKSKATVKPLTKPSSSSFHTNSTNASSSGGHNSDLTTPKAPSTTDDTTDDNDNDDHDYSTLFIKNLNFTTTEASLQTYIQTHNAHTGLRAISIPHKMKGNIKQSMGFGFAEYVNYTAAYNALKVLNNTLCEGHVLEIKPSDKRITIQHIKTTPTTSTNNNNNTNNTNNTNNIKPNTKLIVRNIAFQCTQTELNSLFSTFGHVKRVRIPKKHGG